MPVINLNNLTQCLCSITNSVFFKRNPVYYKYVKGATLMGESCLRRYCVIVAMPKKKSA